MSETVIDGVSVSSGGGTESGKCAIKKRSPAVLFELSGYTSNSTDLDFEITGAAPESDGTIRNFAGAPSAVTGVDGSSNGALVYFEGLEGVSHLELTVTNNAASSTTITVKEVTG